MIKYLVIGDYRTLEGYRDFVLQLIVMKKLQWSLGDVIELDQLVYMPDKIFTLGVEVDIPKDDVEIQRFFNVLPDNCMWKFREA